MKRKRIYEKPSMAVVEIDPVSILAASTLESPSNTIKTYGKDNQNSDATFSW